MCVEAPKPTPGDPARQAAPAPDRPGFDPTVHNYVAHYNDGRPIQRDPFYAGRYNPHIGRYQPTETEIQDERDQLRDRPRHQVAPEAFGPSRPHPPHQPPPLTNLPDTRAPLSDQLIEAPVFPNDPTTPGSLALPPFVTEHSTPPDDSPTPAFTPADRTYQDWQNWFDEHKFDITDPPWSEPNHPAPPAN